MHAVINILESMEEANNHDHHEYQTLPPPAAEWNNPNIPYVFGGAPSSSLSSATMTVDWTSLLSGQGGEADVGLVDEEEKRKGVSAKRRKPRFAFHTRSDDDILDDGFRWRKYGQKAVKNSAYPRSYYRCTHHTCHVKKQVQRLSKDTSVVVTTYEGIHNHPCEKLMETLAPLLKQMQFLSRF